VYSNFHIKYVHEDDRNRRRWKREKRADLAVALMMEGGERRGAGEGNAYGYIQLYRRCEEAHFYTRMLASGKQQGRSVRGKSRKARRREKEEEEREGTINFDTFSYTEDVKRHIFTPACWQAASNKEGP
jgi:hypothetical protein